MFEVIVIGDGPAGTAAATGLAEAGVDVALVGRARTAPWPNAYGAWVDELEVIGLASAAAHTWPETFVYFDDDRPRALGRRYARIDNVRLEATLRARFDAAGGASVLGEALAITHDAHGSTLTLTAPGHGTRELRAKLVVDATGHDARFVERPQPAGPIAAQVAYGVVAELRSPGRLARDGMTLMDFRAGHLDAADGAVPTFLYAMPFADGRVFVEETSLSARPPLGLDVLEARLAKRLDAMGVELGAVEHVERCFIPMGLPRPSLDQRVVGYGAAAGLVHPATGYMVRDALELAPAFGRAIKAALDTHPDDPRSIARAGWDTIWTRDRRRLWDVYTFGLDVLLALDTRGVQRFFSTFFTLGPREWAGYLSGRNTPSELFATMAHVFRLAPWTIRARLAGASLTPASRDLWRGVFGER
ncbi:lycopene cyclase family protein [Myxococcota bacterium]|nr:lycopene cyclase family protein [Myxococcota bacterium]